MARSTLATSDPWPLQAPHCTTLHPEHCTALHLAALGTSPRPAPAEALHAGHYSPGTTDRLLTLLQVLLGRHAAISVSTLTWNPRK